MARLDIHTTVFYCDVPGCDKTVRLHMPGTFDGGPALDRGSQQGWCIDQHPKWQALCPECFRKDQQAGEGEEVAA